MALTLADRVQETTTTTGTGTVTLAGAVAGYQSFSTIGNGNTTYYTITSDTAWEVGIGTYTSSGTTLSRDTVLSSSDGGSKISLTGLSNVFVTYPAERAITEGYGTLPVANGGTGATVASTARTNLSAAASGANTDITSIALTTGTVSTAPASNTDIANKQYVDTVASSGIHFHQPVRVESPINLNATYNNGTAGVGATLTNAGTQAALVIDGVTVSVADRVLVYEQTDETQNGIYVVTSVGSGSTNWVLTRSSDADTFVNASPDGLSEGSTVFVQQGTTGAGETYTCNTQGTITFGTTNITFAQISSAQIYSAGTGLTLTGTVFSLTAPVAVALGGTGATDAATALSNLGAYPASNPSGYTSNAGTVTTVGGTGTVNGITLTGSVTSSGNLTLGGTLSNVDLSSQITGTLGAANGGTGVTSPGASGNVLTSDGTVWSSQPPSAGGITYTTVKTSNYTAADSEGVQTDTSGGAFTVTLPATPAVGDQVIVVDTASSWATNNLTVGRNGSTIEGLSEDLVCNISNVSVQLVYSGTTWNVFAQAGGAGASVIDINSQTSGTLSVSRGGTGATTLTGVVKGNGTSAFTTGTVSLTSEVSDTLPIANGGTGATTAGAALTALGAAASGANTDITALDQDVTITATGTIAANTIGYRGLPQNSQTASYTLALADQGKHISITTGGVVIPANGSVAFPIGTTIVIFNNSGSNQTISITSDTLRLAGAASTGSRTLAQYGLATCVKVAATTWVASGNVT
jgi:hypothetical protein